MLDPSEVVRALVQAPFLVAFLALDGGLVWSNYTMGQGRAVLLGRPVIEGVAEEDREAFVAACRAAWFGQPTSVSARLIDPRDPEGVRVVGTVSPVRDADGRIQHVLLVARSAEDLVRLAQAAQHNGEPSAPGEWFSPLGSRVFHLLLTHKGAPVPAEAIARELGEPLTGDLRAVLREYAHRKIIEGTNRGYRVH